MATELPKNRFLDATGVKKLWDLLTGKIPATLPNPESLTIKNSSGTAQVTYDGSTAESLTLTKSMVGLSDVENTKLSTWTGSSNLTTCKQGSFGSIVTKSDTDYMVAGDTSHATHVTSGDQTWSGIKSLTSQLQILNGSDLILRAPDSNTIDSGDICFADNSGKELSRLYTVHSSDKKSGQLKWRYLNSSNTYNDYTVIHTGNIGSQSVNAATYATYLGDMSSNYTKAGLDSALAGKMAAGDTSHATHVTSDAQTWTGTKTFDNGLVSNSDITVTGKVNASGGFFETSDERLKNIEKPLNIDFENLAKLQKIYFTFKSNPDKLEIGVLAQEVQSIYPELVSSKEDGTLTVDYAKLSVIALAAVDELYKQNKEFDERLTKIEKILNC